jgi:cell wall-associated NlpC family hydrolase
MLLKLYKSSARLLAFLTLSTLTLSACSTFSPRTTSGASSSPKIAHFKNDISVGSEDISIAAIGLVGVPYRYGGNTPKGGFDCSGLVVYVVKNTRQKTLPRTSSEMGKYGKPLQAESPAPGDLVFFNTLGDRHSHVGIYVGAGRFVHAPSTGGTVRIDEIKNPYWAPRFTEARRVINP